MTRCPTQAQIIHDMIEKYGKDAVMDCKRSFPQLFKIHQHVEFLKEHSLPNGNGDEPLITEGATRPIRALPKREQKRVAQTIKDKIQTSWKDKPRITNSMVKKEIDRLQGVHTVKGKVAGAKLQANADPNKSIFPPTNPPPPILHRGNDVDVAIDTSRMFPEAACLCRGCKFAEGCSALVLFRERMREVYAK